LLVIPIIYVKEKQAFRKEGGILRFLGKPIDVARKLKDEGYRLIHIVDLDALALLSTNLDIYDALTYFVNVQVECAPDDTLVKKLLSLKCRVVLAPSELDLSQLKERKLLVAKIPKDFKGSVNDYHDIILEDADNEIVKRFLSLKKRIIIFDKDKDKVKEEVWGIITSAF